MSATATKPPLKLRAGDPIAILYRTRHVSGGIDLRKGIFLDCTWQHGYLVVLLQEMTVSMLWYIATPSILQLWRWNPDVR